MSTGGWEVAQGEDRAVGCIPTDWKGLQRCKAGSESRENCLLGWRCAVQPVMNRAQGPLLRKRDSALQKGSLELH